MSGFLRYLGILNTGVWLGAAIFFTFGIGPAVFSKEMHGLLGENNYPYFSGAIAQIFIHRYFRLQLICGAIALLHVTFEHFYLGKAWQQLWLGLLVGLFVVGLFGATWLEPRMKQLHTIKYATNSSPAARTAAAESFKSWHATSQITNLLVLLALGAYLWRLANPPETSRFISATNFRG